MGLDVRVVDFDGDGIADIVANLGWSRNAGSGNFEPPRSLSFNSRDLTDLDGDGDLDVVNGLYRSETGGPFSLTWLENTDGIGTFEQRETHPIQDVASASLTFADLNGDGRSDILYRSSSSTYRWFESSTEDGPFLTSHPTEIDIEGKLLVADIDGDQDLDLVSRTSQAERDGHLFQWFENDGTGRFSETQEPFATDWTNNDIRFADLDGDKDLDLVVADTLIDGEPVARAWIENNSGTFTAESIRPIEIAGPVRDFALADFDGDSDLDLAALVLSSVSQSASLSDSMPGSAWQENLNGKGEFGPLQSISETRIPTETHRATLKDVDADGIADISWTNAYGHQGWFRQHSNGGFEESQTLSTDDGLPYNGDRIQFDLDGDGDLDFVDRTGGWSWFESEGEAYHERRFDGFDFRPISYDVADLDADGDADILAVSKRSQLFELSWIENLDGNGSFAPQESIRDLLIHPDRFRINIFPIDVELDGDYDIVIEPNAGEYHWFENNGTGVFSEAKSLNPAAGEFERLIYADGDGDGLTDQVLGISDNTISWQRDLFSTFAWESRFDAMWWQRSTDRSPTSAWLGVDFDNDDDIDVVEAGRALSWRENVDGQLIDSKVLEVEMLVNWSANDVDGDGDMDLISAGRGRVSWYENRLVGDANDDGKVGFDDFLSLSANFGAIDAVWATGDFTSDGKVSFEDFLALSANFAQRRGR